MPSRVFAFALLLGLHCGCGPQSPDSGAGGAGGSTATPVGGSGAASAGKLPDGTSCAPAPADAPGAGAAWQRFLDWHATNAAVCGDTQQWPKYDCWVRAADPRSVQAFTSCMMADGCSSISNEDACVSNPQNPSAGYQLSGSALAWYQNVCIPKSVQCGFSNDNCGVFAPVLRPELRCAIADCIEGSCGNFNTCMKAVRERFLTCSQ